MEGPHGGAPMRGPGAWASRTHGPQGPGPQGPGAPWGTRGPSVGNFFQKKSADFKVENRQKRLYTPYHFEMKFYDIEPMLKAYIQVFQPPGKS